MVYQCQKILQNAVKQGASKHIKTGAMASSVRSGKAYVSSNVYDEPIYVGFGHVIPKMKNGVKKYKIEFFPKVKFKPFMVDAKTKGDSLEFTTPSVEALIFEDINGDWEKHNIYSTEAEANTALDALFVQSEG